MNAFNPLLESPGGAVYQLTDLSRALHMVRAREARRGFPYEWVICTRTDFIWLAPHPPLHLLDPTHAWVPSGQDWGGINDRHAVLARPLADIYFSRFKFLAEDGLRRACADDVKHERCYETFNAERFLGTFLSLHNITVGYFTAVAAIGCCTPEECGLRECFAYSLP
ncbi:unnamed protein product, partial [Phaeothamnion confervicola]